MKTNKIKLAKEVIKKIAKQNGVSENYVIYEIDNAIKAGYYNPNPEIQKYCKNLPFCNSCPKPLEFIAYIGKII